VSLRSKLLALFVALAVVPLVAVGAYGYAQSLRALRALLERETATIANDVAGALTRELARQESIALLLTENAETQRLYRVPVSARGDSTLAKADTFLTEAWRRLGGTYRSLELRDATGAVMYHLGDGTPSSGEYATHSVALERAVRDIDSGDRRGSLVLHASLDALVPQQLLERHVGERGYSVVIDRRRDRVLFHPRASLIGERLERLAAAEPWADTTRLEASNGTFRYGAGDSARVVSYASLQWPALTVLSVASVAEFAPPFERARSVQLATVLALTVVITIVFARLLRGATRSLEELTVAADAVGHGNLAPSLPRGDGDEVGRLARAFETMVRRVREMIAQVESSRQMAVIGEFASQIAHEIRNPLTSIKLNLQGLARDARTGALSTPAAAAVDICMLEIDRLDGVVSGVLTLAQTSPGQLRPCSVHGIVRDAVRVATVQASSQGVAVDLSLGAERDVATADASRLHGAILNLLLNALAAMPGGGRLRVTTEQSDAPAPGRFRLRVADTGHGVPAAERERIFRPFHTTRPNGTGLGLPIARRTVEALGGRLTLSDHTPGDVGAEFVIELPLSADPVPATRAVEAIP
jgi:signal transduction histidine kinase